MKFLKISYNSYDSPSLALSSLCPIDFGTLHFHFYSTLGMFWFSSVTQSQFNAFFSSFHEFVYFFVVSLLISSFIKLQWKRIQDVISLCLCFLRCAVSITWSILVKGLWTAKKNVHSFLFEWDVLGISVIPIWFVVTLDFSVSLLSFVQLINLLTVVLYWSRETDLCGFRHKSGTSEGLGLSQDLYGSRKKSGTSEKVGWNQRPLQVQARVWDFLGSRFEPGCQRVWAWVWDLPGSRPESEASAGPGVSLGPPKE